MTTNILNEKSGQTIYVINVQPYQASFLAKPAEKEVNVEFGRFNLFTFIQVKTISAMTKCHTCKYVLG